MDLMANGVELARSLVKKNIPFIFITQSRDRSTYNAAQSLKPLAYLVKPFDLFTLQSTLEQAVRTLSDAPRKEEVNPENDPERSLLQKYLWSPL